ncbi:DUF6228 family protein [Streptomyces griseoviridis]|uniref:DUF6228 family protein n=1 Tax=Streptomyces griseoviridis TaxID=45398 RepID=UPI001E4CD04A|nr:DUF6228 family protein [Streptomyces niveoruber]
MAGAGPDAFLASLADDFRGREGVRTWHSLGYELSLSAQHLPGGHVELTRVIREPAPHETWRSGIATGSAAGEDVRRLAVETGAFPAPADGQGRGRRPPGTVGTTPTVKGARWTRSWWRSPQQVPRRSCSRWPPIPGPARVTASSRSSRAVARRRRTRSPGSWRPRGAS